MKQWLPFLVQWKEALPQQSQQLQINIVNIEQLNILTFHHLNTVMNNKEKCIICNSTPQDVLVLTCNHCICLQCAPDKVQSAKTQHQYIIECGRCAEITDLEQDLYNQLMNLVSSKTNNKKRHQNVLNRDLHKRQDRQYRQNNGCNQLQKTCNFHEDYPIMYVCKTCNDIFICPQCIINGNHKNHTAIVIQKQGEKIKNKLQFQLSKIDQKIDQLQKMQLKRLSKIGQRKKELQKLRDIATRQYEQIKQAIAKEEHTVISKCNQLISSHQKQKDSFKLEIMNQIKSFEDQRISIIDLLNPLLQESLMGQSRALQKMMMVNLVQEYKIFKKDCQRNRQNYIKIADERMEQDMEIIASLTQKIDRIKMNQFKTNRKQLNEIKTSNKKQFVGNFHLFSESLNHTCLLPSKQFDPNTNAFFRLL